MSVFSLKPHGCPEEQVKKVKVEVTQSCPTLCDPWDYTVHGVFQAKYWSG